MKQKQQTNREKRAFSQINNKKNLFQNQTKQTTNKQNCYNQDKLSCNFGKTKPLSTNVKDKSLSNSKIRNHCLNQIPKISNAEMVVSIDFGYNKIISIPKYIQTLVQVQQINLQNNSITRIQNIFDLVKLKILLLGHNKISQVPTQMIKLQKLQFLDLSFNYFSFISQISPLSKMIQKRKLLSQSLSVNLQGNQVFKFKAQINKILRIQSTVQQKLSQQTNQLNKVLPQKCNSNSMMMEKGQETSIETGRDKNNKQNNQNQIIIQRRKTPQKRNLKFDCKSELSGSRQQQQKQIIQKSINQSLLISPNFRKQCSIHTKKSVVAQKILNQAQFKVICQQNQYLLNKLHASKQKFNLLRQLKNIPINISQIYIQNCVLVYQTICQFQIICNMLKDTTILFENQSGQRFQGQIKKCLQKKQLNTKEIQINHEEIVKEFVQIENCSLLQYKTWLYQYSKFKELIPLIVSNAFKLSSIIKKFYKIADILSINLMQDKLNQSNQAYIQQSDNKIDKTTISQINLQKLLFSKDKSQISKQSSIKKRSYGSSDKKTCAFIKNNKQQKCLNQCFQCILKDQEIINLKSEIQKLKQCIKLKDKQIEKHKNQNKIISQNVKLIQNVKRYQQKIIQEIQEIQGSTYQNILFEQATAIQQMLKIQKLSFQATKNKVDLSTKKKLQQQNIMNNYLLNTKNSSTFQSNRNSKTKKNNRKISQSNNLEKQISQFVLPVQQAKQCQTAKSKIQYFRNANQSNNQQNGVIQKKLRNNCSFSKKNETMIKSKFQNNKVKDTQLFNDLQYIQNKKSNSENKKSAQQLKNKNQSQKINSNYRNKEKFFFQSFKTQEFVSKLIEDCEIYKRQNKQSKLMKSQSEQIKVQKQWPRKNVYNYLQLQLQQKKEYKRYIDYHLRNNIQKILNKNKQKIMNINENKASKSQIASLCKRKEYIEQDNQITINKVAPIFIKKAQKG